MRKTNWHILLIVGLLLLLISAGCQAVATPTPFTTAPGFQSVVRRSATPENNTQTNTAQPTPQQDANQPAHPGTPFPTASAPISAENAAQLTEIARWGKGIPQAITWQADKTDFVVATTRGLYRYNQDLTLQQTIETGQSFRSALYSPNGQILAAGSENGDITLWKHGDNQPFATLEGQQLAVLSLSFSSDGKTLACGSWDGSVYIWDVDTQQKVQEIEAEGGVRQVAFADDDNSLMIWSVGFPLRVWGLDNNQIIRSINMGKNEDITPQAVALSPDSKLLVFNRQQTLQVVNTDNAYTLLTFERSPANDVRHMAFSADSQYLALATDNLVQLWQPQEGLLVQELLLPGEYAAPDLIAFSDDSSKLVIAGEKLWLWDLSKLNLTAEIKVSTGLDDLTLSPDGKTLFTWGQDSQLVKLWNINDGLSRTLKVDVPVQSAVFSPDSKTLVIASDSVRLWQVDNLQNSLTLTTPIDEEANQEYKFRIFEDGITTYAILREQIPFASVAFSPDGKQLAGGSFDGQVYLWNLPDGEEQTVLPLNVDGNTTPLRVQGLSFSADGNKLAALSEDGKLLIWQLPQAEITASFEIPPDQIPTEEPFCNLFLEDGQILAAWNQQAFRFSLADPAQPPAISAALCGFSLNTGTTVQENPLSTNGALLQLGERETYPDLESLRYQPQQEVLIIEKAGRGSIVQLWQVDDQQADRQLLHFSAEALARSGVTLIDFQIAGNSLLAGWSDSSLWIYDIPQGNTTIIHLPQNNPTDDTQDNLNQLSSLAISPDGKSLFTAAWNGNLSLWQISSEGYYEAQPLEQTNQPVNASVFSPDGSLLAANSADQKVFLWSSADASPLAQLSIQANPLDLAFSNDNSLLAVRTIEGIQLWQLADKTQINTYAGFSIAFSPDATETLLAAANIDEQRNRLIQIWPTKQTQDSALINWQADGGQLSFTPDGDLLAISSIQLQAWNTDNGTSLFKAQTHAPYGKIRFSADSDMLALAGGDGALRLWQIK